MELLGGRHSATFSKFINRSISAFLLAREKAADMLSLVAAFRSSNLSCFQEASNVNVVDKLRDRFLLHLSADDIALFVKKMIDSAANNVHTRLYDLYQFTVNKVLY